MTIHKVAEACWSRTVAAQPFFPKATAPRCSQAVSHCLHHPGSWRRSQHHASNVPTTHASLHASFHPILPLSCAVHSVLHTVLPFCAMAAAARPTGGLNGHTGFLGPVYVHNCHVTTHGIRTQLKMLPMLTANPLTAGRPPPPCLLLNWTRTLGPSVPLNHTTRSCGAIRGIPGPLLMHIIHLNDLDQLPKHHMQWPHARAASSDAMGGGVVHFSAPRTSAPGAPVANHTPCPPYAVPLASVTTKSLESTRIVIKSLFFQF